MYYNGTRYVLAFLFVPLLRKDLIEFMSDWNEHPMQKNRSVSPSDRPNDLYSIPSIYGKRILYNCISGN